MTGETWNEQTLWPEGTHVSHSASQDDDKAQTTHDTCGPISGTPFAYYDPDTHCWKTCQGTLVSGLDTYSQTWPSSGMTADGTAYQLPASAHLTDEIGCSQLLPTPTSRDHKDGHAPRFRHGRIQKDTLGRAIGGPLNPTWVEWLMGFPPGWTDLED